jgi:hypothetical protein
MTFKCDFGGGNRNKHKAEILNKVFPACVCGLSHLGLANPCRIWCASASALVITNFFIGQSHVSDLLFEGAYLHRETLCFLDVPKLLVSRHERTTHFELLMVPMETLDALLVLLFPAFALRLKRCRAKLAHACFQVFTPHVLPCQ